MLDKIRAFFEMEYTSTEKFVKSSYAKGYEKMTIEKTISRCLGVAQFVQSIGVSYEDIYPLYEDYKKKLELLLEDTVGHF